MVDQIWIWLSRTPFEVQGLTILSPLVHADPRSLWDALGTQLRRSSLLVDQASHFTASSSAGVKRFESFDYVATCFFTVMDNVDDVPLSIATFCLNLKCLRLFITNLDSHFACLISDMMAMELVEETQIFHFWYHGLRYISIETEFKNLAFIMRIWNHQNLETFQFKLQVVPIVTVSDVRDIRFVDS